MIESISPPEIERALRARDFASVRQAFAEQFPADVAELIESLEEEERALLFRLLPRDQASETFEYLDFLTDRVFESALRAGGGSEQYDRCNYGDSVFHALPPGTLLISGRRTDAKT